MKISIFGLGYVGCVTSAVLVKEGHYVIGVDVNKTKVEMIKNGNSPIIEKDIDLFIREGHKKGLITATEDVQEALLKTELSVICVGTPSSKEGHHEITSVLEVLNSIKNSLKLLNREHTIIVRSTIPPKTMETKIIPLFKNMNVGLAFNPEFLREGTAVADYYHPPYIVAAVDSERTKEKVKQFYFNINTEFYFTSFEVAETLKMVCNVFHALKIVFANEIKRFCESYVIDPFKVMELVCQDKKLNISEKYLTPGSAYGGSCLPKDLRSFVALSKRKYLNLPVIQNIAHSNEEHIADTIEKVSSYNSKKLGIFGLSFKSGTDDLRESPTVKLVEYFLGKGYDIKIYDSHLNTAKLMGANKNYIEKEIPHINQLLVENQSDIFNQEIIILTRDEPINEYLKEHHKVIDLK